MKGIKKYFGIILFALSLVLSVSSAMPEIGGCVDVQAAKIKINKTKASVYIGKSFKLKVTGTKAETTWWSDNESVATVSENTGKVTGKKKGTAIIYGYVNNRALSIVKCKVTVNSVISVSPKTLYMDGVDDETIKVTLKKSCGLSYSISNPDIVSCSWDDDWYKNGKVTYLYVTAEKTGTTYITISNKYSSEKVKIKVVVDIDSDDGNDNNNDTGNTQLVMAAMGIQKAYNSAKFPSSLHIRNIAYEESFINGYGDNISRLVVHAYAKNSFGGYGDIYSVVIRSKTNTHYSNAFEYNGYYYTTSAFSHDPGMNGVWVNNKAAVNMWKYLYDKNIEIPYD